MTVVPDSVTEFLRGRRFAVAGVSRSGRGVGNAVARKLRAAGYEVFPVHPLAAELEGTRCYATVAAVPGPVDGLVITTHPDAAVDLVRQCAEAGVGAVWMHRSFGRGSVSEDAVRECRERGIRCIAGGCPLMFCRPVDLAHRCMAWWLGRRGRLPG